MFLRIVAESPLQIKCRKLDAAALARAASVVWNRRYIFDELDRHAGGLEGGDGAFATGTGALHADFHFLHAILGGLFSGLLCGTLAGERSALATSLEVARSTAGPAENVAFDVGDRDHGVVERGANVRDRHRDIAARFAFLCLGNLRIH